MNSAKNNDLQKIEIEQYRMKSNEIFVTIFEIYQKCHKLFIAN